MAKKNTSKKQEIEIADLIIEINNQLLTILNNLKAFIENVPDEYKNIGIEKKMIEAYNLLLFSFRSADKAIDYIWAITDTLKAFNLPEIHFAKGK